MKTSHNITSILLFMFLAFVCGTTACSDDTFMKNGIPIVDEDWDPTDPNLVPHDPRIDNVDALFTVNESSLGPNGELPDECSVTLEVKFSPTTTSYAYYSISWNIYVDGVNYFQANTPGTQRVQTFIVPSTGNMYMDISCGHVWGTNMQLYDRYILQIRDCIVILPGKQPGEDLEPPVLEPDPKYPKD